MRKPQAEIGEPKWQSDQVKMKIFSVLIVATALFAGSLLAQPGAKAKQAAEKREELSNRLAQFRGTGIGIILGDLYGLAVKKWVDRKAALVLGLGWPASGEEGVHVHIDYISHNLDLEKAAKGGPVIYHGLGERFRSGSPNQFGFRIVLGLMLPLKKKPIDFFIELAPTLNVAPETNSEIIVSGGIRFFSKSKSRSRK